MKASRMSAAALAAAIVACAPGSTIANEYIQIDLTTIVTPDISGLNPYFLNYGGTTLVAPEDYNTGRFGESFYSLPKYVGPGNYVTEYEIQYGAIGHILTQQQFSALGGNFVDWTPGTSNYPTFNLPSGGNYPFGIWASSADWRTVATIPIDASGDTLAFGNWSQVYEEIATPALITTNQFSSPCINPSGSCSGGATITQTGNVSVGGPLVIGKGGGAGTLTVGPATLTASSTTIGGTSAGSGTVQSGGSIQTGALNIGGMSTSGSLEVQGGGKVSAQSVVLGNTGSSIGLDAASNLTIGGTAPSAGEGLTLNGGTLQYSLGNSAAPLITVNGGAQMVSGTITLSPTGPTSFNPTPGTNFQLLQTSAGGLSGLLKGYVPPTEVANGGRSYLSVPFGGTTIQTPFLKDTVSEDSTGKFSGQSNYLVPIVQNSSLLSANTVGLTYLPSNASLSTNQEYLIAKLAADSDVSKIQINSTDRTIDEQALAMTQNLIKAFQAADAGALGAVPAPGATQRAFYELLLGDGPATGGSYQSLINSTNPNSVFASTFLTYDASTRTFSVQPGVNPNNIPPDFLSTAANDILQAQTTTGKPISKHVANDLVQAVDIQIGSNSNSTLIYGTPASQFKNRATQLLGNGLTAVLCPPSLGCSVSEGSSNVFHLELNNSQVDPFAGDTPTSELSTQSGSTYAYQFDASADTPYALDPAVASKYLFNENPGSTPFSSILLPDTLEINGYYQIYANYGFGLQFVADIDPGQRYFFLLPVYEFEVIGTGLSSMNADFSPQVTFDAAGMFDGSITTNSVPETSTWIMMLLGFASLGAAGYRASRNAV